MKRTNMRRLTILLLAGVSLFPAVAAAQTTSSAAGSDPVGNAAAGTTTPGQIGAAQAALAPSPGDLANAQTADIVVTAQKRSQSVRDVPLSITAVSGGELVSKGITDVQGLVKVTPGLSFVESGRGVPVFSLRGVGFFDQSIGARPTVSVYLDEAPLPFSIMAKGAAFDLERVEVLKGPQGTLFGQNATGGAINYIAAKPTAQLAAGATASFGRFDTADVQAYVSGPLGPTLEARLAVRGLAGGDWQRSYTRDDTIGSQRFSQARLLLEWRPTSRLKVGLNLNGSYDRSDTQAPQFEGVRRAAATIALLNTYPVAPADDRSADFDAGKNYRRHNGFYQTVLRADYSVSDTTTLTSLTSYSDQHVNQFSEGDGTALTNYDTRVRGNLSSISQELRAAGSVGALDYIVGGNYSHDTTNEDNRILFPYSTNAFTISAAIPFDDVSTLSHQRFDSAAGFVDLTYSPIRQIRLHGGARYTDTDLRYTGCSVGQDASSAQVYTILANRTRATLGLAPIATAQPGQCAIIDQFGNVGQAAGDLHEHNVSWRGGVDVKPRQGMLFYLSVSKGFKAGSVPTPAATSTVQFTPVTQESVIAYEAGVKTDLFDKRLQVTAAGFYYDYRNKQLLGRQVFQPNVFGPLSALVNVPKSRIQGFEGQATVFPVKGLTLTAAGTYLDTKVLSDFLNYSILNVQANFNGSPFPYTPKWQVVLDGSYRFPLSDRLNGTFGANANYRTSTTAGFGGDSRLDINSYWLVDLQGGVEARDGRWRVQLYGRNVTNQYYWNNVVSALDNIRRYTGMPATYGIQASIKY